MDVSQVFRVIALLSICFCMLAALRSLLSLASQAFRLSCYTGLALFITNAAFPTEFATYQKILTSQAWHAVARAGTFGTAVIENAVLKASRPPNDSSTAMQADSEADDGDLAVNSRAANGPIVPDFLRTAFD